MGVIMLLRSAPLSLLSVVPLQSTSRAAASFPSSSRHKLLQRGPPVRHDVPRAWWFAGLRGSGCSSTGKKVGDVVYKPKECVHVARVFWCSPLGDLLNLFAIWLDAGVENLVTEEAKN